MRPIPPTNKKKGFQKKEAQNKALKVLEVLLSPIISPRQPFSKVEISLSSHYSNNEISDTIKWTKVIAGSNLELAYVFATQIGQARKTLERKTLNTWLLKSLSIYDREGLYPAVRSFAEIEAFKKKNKQDACTAYFHEVKPLLDHYVRGLSGRPLSLKEGGSVYTDTQFLCLPKSLNIYADKAKNKVLYKAMVCFLWAQTQYGTFKRKRFKDKSTQKRLEAYADPTGAKRIFLHLENIRLLANIERDLPGLFREINALTPLIIPQDKTWKLIAQRLHKSGSGVEDTFKALEVLQKLQITLPEINYQGGLNLDQVEMVIEQRKEEILNKINTLLKKSDNEGDAIKEAIDKLSQSEINDAPLLDADNEDKDQQSDGSMLDAELQQDLESLIRKLLQDFDELDSSDITGSSSLIDKEIEEKVLSLGENRADTELFEFDEWDYLRQNYRENWCQLSVKPIDDAENGFKHETLEKHAFLRNKIRRVFEMMRDQPQKENKQTDGEEIDLDALVQMYTAKQAGQELSERMYIRRQQNTRSVSVCLLVDMSGSTKGWINLAMRESLILFSEALKTLGDQFAIYGFSGLTRQRCEIYQVKTFENNNHKQISARIGNIKAKDYTRMGVAIRYAGQQLDKIESKHRLLLILSDGKPDDYDGYQGQYGIQDTRKAILEVQGRGIKSFSITIDKKAQSYLPSLFGPGQYTILDNVATLPLKLSEVYQKLST